MEIISHLKAHSELSKKIGHNFPLFKGKSGVTCRYSETKHQVSLKQGSLCRSGTDQSKSELWSPYHFVGIPSQLGCKQTASDQPVPWSQTSPGIRGGERRVATGILRLHHTMGRSFRDRRNRYDATAFCDTGRKGPKTTTLRKRIRESQASNYRQLPPPRRGRPSCNDAVRWRSEFGSGSFYSPEPGRATAFRDTPPSRADRRFFVFLSLIHI